MGAIALADRRLLEDFAVGQTFESDEDYEVTPERLRDYAAEFDPQGIHLDAQIAAREMFGEIAAGINERTPAKPPGSFENLRIQSDRY